MSATRTPSARSMFAMALLALYCFTALRLIVSFVSPLQLGGDEAQYWSWSRELEWGYYSKPPLIAWAIAASTALFGQVEWAVRLPALLGHAAAAGLLGWAALRAYGSTRIAGWTVLVYTLMPAVFLSSQIMSTDAVLAPWWALGLVGVAHLGTGAKGPWGLAVGLAVGVGLLAKYAMLYFIIGLVLAAIVHKPLRQALLSWHGALGALLGGAIVAPHFWWNAQNDFATVSHTAANANLGGSLFNPGELLQFFIDQLAVFGPIAFPVLVILIALVVLRRDYTRPMDLVFVCFTAPPILTIMAQAFISRAHANWAAMAYLGGAILFAALLVNGRKRWLATATVALHAALGLILMGAFARPQLAESTPGLGPSFANATKRMRGWMDTAEAVREAAVPLPTAILTDDRMVFYALQFYAPDIPVPLRMWQKNEGPENHAELVAPLEPELAGDVLVVNTIRDYTLRIEMDFAAFSRWRSANIQVALGKTRPIDFYRAAGYRRQERGEAYEAQFNALP